MISARMQAYLEKTAGVFERAAERMLKDKKHSLIKGYFGGGALGTVVGGTGGAAFGDKLLAARLRKDQMLADILSARGLTPEQESAVGRIVYGIKGTMLGGAAGSAGGVLAQHLRNRAKVKALASKLRTGAIGLGAGAAGLGALAAYKKRDK